MKTYLITAVTGDGADIRSQYVGTQADAAKLRSELVKEGFKRANIMTSEVEVPTDKVGLIAFLNR